MNVPTGSPVVVPTKGAKKPFEANPSSANAAWMFVHVPKAAGSFFIEALKQNKNHEDVALGRPTNIDFTPNPWKPLNSFQARHIPSMLRRRGVIAPTARVFFQRVYEVGLRRRSSHVLHRRHVHGSVRNDRRAVRVHHRPSRSDGAHVERVRLLVFGRKRGSPVVDRGGAREIERRGMSARSRGVVRAETKHGGAAHGFISASRRTHGVRRRGGQGESRERRACDTSFKTPSRTV